jgi:hypothetical protein
MLWAHLQKPFGRYVMDWIGLDWIGLNHVNHVYTCQGMTSLPNYVEYTPNPGTPLAQICSAASADAIELLSLLLRFDPNRRCSASQVCCTRYGARCFTPHSQSTFACCRHCSIDTLPAHHFHVRVLIFHYPNKVASPQARRVLVQP